MTNFPPELEWIDAHHHLWDLSRIDYPWLLAKGEARFFGQPDPIRKDYLVKDSQNDAGDFISRSVHIQVGAGQGLEFRGGCLIQVHLGVPERRTGRPECDQRGDDGHSDPDATNSISIHASLLFEESNK